MDKILMNIFSAADTNTLASILDGGNSPVELVSTLPLTPIGRIYRVKTFKSLQIELRYPAMGEDRRKWHKQFQEQLLFAPKSQLKVDMTVGDLQHVNPNFANFLHINELYEYVLSRAGPVYLTSSIQAGPAYSNSHVRSVNEQFLRGDNETRNITCVNSQFGR